MFWGDLNSRLKLILCFGTNNFPDFWGKKNIEFWAKNCYFPSISLIISHFPDFPGKEEPFITKIQVTFHSIMCSNPRLNTNKLKQTWWVCVGLFGGPLQVYIHITVYCEYWFHSISLTGFVRFFRKQKWGVYKGLKSNL